MLSYIRYYCNYQVILRILKYRLLTVLAFCLYTVNNIYAAPLSSVTDGVVSVTEKAVQSIKDLGEESRDWEKYVRNFRKEHSLSLMVGYSGKTWSFSTKEGENKKSNINGVEIGVRYSYDVSLYRGLGYFLGSALFYKIPTSSGYLDCFGEFNLPGITGGFVINLNPMFRIYLGSELSVVRITDLKRRDYPDKDIDISMVELSAIMIMDMFFSLKGGLRLEASYGEYIKKLFYDANFGEEIPRVYETKSLKFKLGYVYHVM